MSFFWGKDSPNQRVVVKPKFSMRFGGDWTPQSSSENMTGCLRCYLEGEHPELYLYFCENFLAEIDRKQGVGAGFLPSMVCVWTGNVSIPTSATYCQFFFRCVLYIYIIYQCIQPEE